ncbi:gag-protease polyprotein [Cucumis melo var. makuwa]|uniref:Gag-protease polyprotein n=1 Tax=Cucumis melo var. makuwa TaxID=1194695 RepID=A0A5D3C189_CUCMM|nr:gag-protease polyprotein [Cucumis melo var. makuwa]
MLTVVVRSKTSRVREVTFRFWGVTTSVVGANSPLFGWIRLDVELNKDFSYSSVMLMCCAVNWNSNVMDYENLNVILNTTVMHNMDVMHNIGKGMMRGRSARGKKDASSHRPCCTSYSCGPCCYGVEVQGFDYTDAGAHQPAPPAPALAPVCPEDQKVQCTVFMLTDRGTARWETTERMLGRQEFLNLEQDDRTVKQYDAEFDMLSRFTPEMIATEATRADKFVRGLRLDIQGLVRAFRPVIHADALCLAMDLSLQERANSSKVAGRGLTLRDPSASHLHNSSAYSEQYACVI